MAVNTKFTNYQREKNLQLCKDLNLQNDLIVN